MLHIKSFFSFFYISQLAFLVNRGVSKASICCKFLSCWSVQAFHLRRLGKALKCMLTKKEKKPKSKTHKHPPQTNKKPQTTLYRTADISHFSPLDGKVGGCVAQPRLLDRQQSFVPSWEQPLSWFSWWVWWVNTTIASSAGVVIVKFAIPGRKSQCLHLSTCGEPKARQVCRGDQAAPSACTAWGWHGFTI